MDKTTLKANGFSLVELLVVVAIIGILTVVAVPAYFNHVTRTRQANGVQKLLDMKTAQEKFYALNDQYALSMAATGFQSLLSFDPADTEYYQFSIPGGFAAANTLAVQIDGDAANAFLVGDCWRIVGAWAEPSTCGTPPAGLSFSVLADLFD